MLKETGNKEIHLGRKVDHSKEKKDFLKEM